MRSPLSIATVKAASSVSGPERASTTSAETCKVGVLGDARLAPRRPPGMPLQVLILTLVILGLGLGVHWAALTMQRRRKARVIARGRAARNPRRELTRSATTAVSTECGAPTAGLVCARCKKAAA
jgi:hypothetical protein